MSVVAASAAYILISLHSELSKLFTYEIVVGLQVLHPYRTGKFTHLIQIITINVILHYIFGSRIPSNTAKYIYNFID